MIENINLWRDIEEYLDKKYPGCWDIQMDEHDSNYGYLYVCYPEIEIVNTSGDKHKITDLFVRMRLHQPDNIRRLQYPSISGMRMSASEGELQGRYLHSHLPTANPSSYNSFSNFCLGSGPIKRHLQKCTFASFTLIDFKLLMTNLDTYVRYESTNTAPYITFKHLAGSEHYKKTNIQLGKVKGYVRQINHPEKVKVLCKNNKAVVKDFSKEVYNDLYTVFPTKHLVSKSADGKYWSLRANYTSRRELEQGVSHLRFTFRGEQLKFKITSEPTNRELYIHPDVEDAIKQYIQNEFNYTTWLGRYLNT